MAEIKSEIERSGTEQQADVAETPSASEPMTEQEVDELLDAMLSPAPEQESELPVPERAVPEQDKDESLAAVLGTDPIREEGQTQNLFMGVPQNQAILRGEEEQGSVANATRQGGASGADFATTKGRAAKSRQSEPTSKRKEQADRDISEPPKRSRRSVRQELDEIRAKRRERAAGREKSPRQKPARHKAPPRKKTRKTKER